MKALSLGTFVIAALAVSALLDSESGLSIWLDLRRDLETSNGRVEQLVRENDALRSEISIFEGEPAAVDRAIREELDLVLPGEVVVRFEPQGGASGEDPADSAGRSGEDRERGDRISDAAAWADGADLPSVAAPGEAWTMGAGSESGAQYASGSTSLPGAADAGQAAEGVPSAGSATSELEAWADDSPTVVDDAEAGGESF